jgi:hypothetical protein
MTLRPRLTPTASYFWPMEASFKNSQRRLPI